MAVPGNRERIAGALVHSGRGIAYFRGLGVTPTPVSDEQIAAMSSVPGGFVYHNVNIIQCALNAGFGADPGYSRLVVDGKWGPKTAHALSMYVSWLATQIAPPDDISNYAYHSPQPGGQVINLTNALYHSLTGGQDISSCLAQTAAGVSPPPPPSHVVAAPAMTSTPAAPTHDWTMY